MDVVKKTLEPTQYITAPVLVLMVGTGTVQTPSETDAAVPVHPAELVTVTPYVPAAVTGKVCVVAPVVQV